MFHSPGIVASCGCGLSKSTSGCVRSEEHTSELQSQSNLVCRLLLEKKKKNTAISISSHPRLDKISPHQLHHDMLLLEGCNTTMRATRPPDPQHMTRYLLKRGRYDR